MTLDALSRELDVLFVVPTGNLSLGDDGAPDDWRVEYPAYLTGPDATLLDPAPALNVLTVGSIARENLGQQQLRWRDDPAYRTVAATDQPSPFTRRGPSVGGAIKPDLVDYGGNQVADVRTGGGAVRPIGVVSTAHDFATGNPFRTDSGTSFAAPRVAHAAARLLDELRDASVDLCRAMLVAHAEPLPACADLFPEAEEQRNVVGYGIVNRSALYRSLDNCVTLWAEELIQDQRHHFFQLPIPPEFWTGRKRDRQITVALAHRPATRTTRIDYRASSISFKFVKADSLNEVANRFNRHIDKAVTENVTERGSSRRFAERVRSKGTVQASTWRFTEPSQTTKLGSWFVVVTRKDPAWGQNLSADREPYALAVAIADRSALDVRLYARIEAQLRLRARARARP